MKNREQRFWEKVDKLGPNGCWIWTACKLGGGHGGPYGSFGADNKKTVLAHRYSYQLEYGAIPNGLELDHLCRNTLCVRPDHLEAVKHKTFLEA